MSECVCVCVCVCACARVCVSSLRCRTARGRGGLGIAVCRVCVCVCVCVYARARVCLYLRFSVHATENDGINFGKERGPRKDLVRGRIKVRVLCGRVRARVCA